MPQDSEMGKALKEMQRRFTFLGLPAHGLYSIVKERTFEGSEPLLGL